MGYDDFFDQERKHRGTNWKPLNKDEDRYSYNPHQYKNENAGYSKALMVLNNIRRNKKLKWVVVIGGIAVLFIALVLIIYLLPLVIKLFNNVSQNGLQGILDSLK
jgi:uncharacterized membrane protein